MVNDTTIINRFIAFKNPFRYRAYYYDFETNLYYLNTRYYDPETGRFINADNLSNLTPDTLNGLNLYAYCINNPVNLIDDNGTSWKNFWKKIGNGFKKAWNTIKRVVSSIGLVVVGIILSPVPGVGSTLIGAGIGGLVGGISSFLNGGSFEAGWLGGTITGGLMGLGVTMGPLGAFLLGFAGNFLGTALTDAMNGINILDLKYILNLAGESALTGIINIGSFFFGEIIDVLNIPGFKDIFFGFSIWGNLYSSYIFEKFKEFFKNLGETLRGKIGLNYKGV